MVTCIQFATHTVAPITGGTLALTGTEFYRLDCGPGEYVLMSGTEYSTISHLAEVAQKQVDLAFAPIDFAEASAYWSIAFFVIIILWSLSTSFNYIRRAISR